MRPADVLAVIPAWTGSNRIPNKNLQLLAGKSLLRRTIDFAMEMGFRTVVTTDNETVNETVRAIGAHHSLVSCLHDGSSSGSVAVWQEAWRAHPDFPVSVLLEPSCPFRTQDDIHQTLEALTRFAATVHPVKTVRGPQPQFNGACYASRDRNMTQDFLGAEWKLIETPWRLQIDKPYDLILARLIA
jgi:CMP-2-keto-3-deoxyoctulosonic acid synthetase